jgi:hypothetical protein
VYVAFEVMILGPEMATEYTGAWTVTVTSAEQGGPGRFTPHAFTVVVPAPIAWIVPT